jgi:hypothetical protein
MTATMSIPEIAKDISRIGVQHTERNNEDCTRYGADNIHRGWDCQNTGCKDDYRPELAKMAANYNVRESTFGEDDGSL